MNDRLSAQHEHLPSDTDLSAILRRLDSARVLVLGDIILDRYVAGHRRPAVAGGADPGAAADQPARDARGRGQRGPEHRQPGRPRHPGRRHRRRRGGRGGNRPADPRARHRCRADRRRIARGWSCCPGGRQRRKPASWSAPTSCCGWTRRPPRASTPATAAGLLDIVAEALEQVEVVVLSDYAKGVLCDAVLTDVIRLARGRGKMVIADPKRADFSAYRGVSLLTPNESEVRVATCIDAADDQGAERAGQATLAATEWRGGAGDTVLQGPDPGAPRPADPAYAHPGARGGRRVRRRRHPGGGAGDRACRGRGPAGSGGAGEPDRRAVGRQARHRHGDARRGDRARCICARSWPPTTRSSPAGRPARAWPPGRRPA